MKKRDFIIIGAILAIALVLLLVLKLADKPAMQVIVYVDDMEYARADIDDYQTVEVVQDDGSVNRVVIDKDGVRMDYSNCKNQLCVQQGTISPDNYEELVLANWIVCLPNGVTVELADADR